MTLPKEISDKIKADAENYAGLFKHGAEYRKPAYADGATEWAGKAKELADALKWIQMHAPIEPVVDDAISAAIAKYKEVGND